MESIVRKQSRKVILLVTDDFFITQLEHVVILIVPILHPRKQAAGLMSIDFSYQSLLLIKRIEVLLIAGPAVFILWLIDPSFVSPQVVKVS